MKVSKNLITGLVGLSLGFGFSGCGDENDTNNLAQGKKINDATILEARSIDTLGNQEKQYFGECRYSTGSMPILIEVNDPVDDVAITLFYKDTKGEDPQEVTTLPNNYGETYYRENGGIHYIWELKLSDDKTFYTGNRHLGDGALIKCNIFASLNAKTKQDLADAIESH